MSARMASSHSLSAAVTGLLSDLVSMTAPRRKDFMAMGPRRVGQLFGQGQEAVQGSRFPRRRHGRGLGWSLRDLR